MLSDRAAELRDAVLDVAWRQWRVLGASTAAHAAPRPGGAAADTPTGTVVDPEALVLVSLALLDHERRLADVIRDWAVGNSDLLSVQRVKNLSSDYAGAGDESFGPRLAWFARVAFAGAKDLRWRSLVAAPGVDTGEAVVPGLRGIGARAAETAAAKPRAVRARFASDASLMLRLRKGFGVGVKADLLALLLSRAEQWAAVRDVADATGYTVAAVRRAADDLAVARLVESRPGQPTTYRVTLAGWAALLDLSARPPGWGSWHERFAFSAAFVRWTATLEARPPSAYALGAHGRALLEKHRRAFEQDGIAVWSAHTPVDDWERFVADAVHALAQWMRAAG